ncbi:MAG TPA: hypothetical protein VFT49_03210 [Candidatus Saccharimonadales bacterium]|nr:hypothetical protein [Candidatus Saccharimonadales bacterium]
MFGLNDDDRPHHDHMPKTDNMSDDSSSSPFAAAYSSLNGGIKPSPHLGDNAGMPEEDLLQIKSQALKSLAPLVGHLDQSPEEKFKTTMMMIQATDNSDLIRDAYSAANQIPDEKARAQALLDVINEINYFTQKGKN